MKNFTTKLIALSMAGIMTFGFAACSAKVTSTESSDEVVIGDNIVGGWQTADSTQMTDDLRAIFEAAMNGQVGVDYEPLALLATQVVSGTNYCFLCKAAAVTPEATPKYTLVYIYQKLDGSAEILNVSDIILPGMENADPNEMMVGGWSYTESADVDEEVMNKATETMTGASYEAIAFIGTQVVAGTNHAVLCKVTPTVPDATSHISIVYIYENLDGVCEITDTVDIGFDAQG